MRPCLLLFDIDGTLLDTKSSGSGALMDAVEEVFGISRHEMPPLDLAGATDGGVVRKLFSDARVEMTPDKVEAYHASYLGHLQRRLQDAAFAGHLLPAVQPLLDTLAAEPQVHLGLLTGNLRRGAFMKLQRLGIHTHFDDGAFGDDAEDRNHLGPIAIQRLSDLRRVPFAPEDVIVIGDTPKDIACAHACGARALAVATGAFSSDQLGPHSPWRCVPSFADHHGIARLLMEAF